jgi:hypothetical protein
MSKRQPPKDMQTKKKDKAAKKAKQSRGKKKAEEEKKKKAEEEVMQEVKKEAGEGNDSNNGTDSDNDSSNASDNGNGDVPLTGAAAASGKKRNLKADGTYSHARSSSDIVRAGDRELLFTVTNPSPLAQCVDGNSGREYIPLPRLNIVDYSQDVEHKTIHALTFVWKNGQRAKMQFARCLVLDPFCPQPAVDEDEDDADDDSDDDDDEEPRWVRQAINTKNPDNLLVLIKNCDDKGVASRCPFPGQTASVLRVSTNLLFYKNVCKCTCGAQRA